MDRNIDSNSFSNMHGSRRRGRTDRYRRKYYKALTIAVVFFLISVVLAACLFYKNILSPVASGPDKTTVMENHRGENQIEPQNETDTTEKEVETETIVQSLDDEMNTSEVPLPARDDTSALPIVEVNANSGETETVDLISQAESSSEVPDQKEKIEETEMTDTDMPADLDTSLTN